MDPWRLACGQGHFGAKMALNEAATRYLDCCGRSDAVLGDGSRAPETHDIHLSRQTSLLVLAVVVVVVVVVALAAAC